MGDTLKYPVLLVHGMGFRDDKRIGYWGRIPKVLRDAGCDVYLSNQDSNGSIQSNGAFLQQRIQEVLAETGAEKVNVIAHSKGGLDTRYAISALDCGKYVASLTTLATPHNGSKTVDWLMKLPTPLVRFVGFCADCWCYFLGDHAPNSYRVFCSFTTAEAEKFNIAHPDCPDVYYQSYAFVMQHPFSDFFLWIPNIVVKKIEGENDGLLPPESVKWGNFKGALRGVNGRGVSHLDEIDFRRRPLSKKRGDGVTDIADVYLQIVSCLQDLGF